MTTKVNTNSYYDDVFHHIQEMERRQFEEDINYNITFYKNKYKCEPSNNTLNLFSSNNEIRSQTVNA